MEKNKEVYERIKYLTEKVRNELISAGIPVSENIMEIRINKRTKKRLGSCQMVKGRVGQVYYIIEISQRVLGCTDKELSMIIAHELIHTCPGCFDHGKKWKMYAAKAEKNAGYKISRTINTADLSIGEIKSQPPRYILTCPGCGQTFARSRMCPLIKTPQRYRCGKCGTSLAGAAIDTICSR